MWADWIVEIWTSVKDYLPEIISAGEAWPLVQRWLQVKRQLWAKLAGPVTGAPSPRFPHFPHFPSPHSHSSSRLAPKTKPSLSLGRVKLQQRISARHSLFSFPFAQLIVWDNSQKEDYGRQERSKANILSRQIPTEYFTSQSKLRFPKSRVTTALKKKTLKKTKLVQFSFDHNPCHVLGTSRYFAPTSAAIVHLLHISCTPCTMSAGFAIH